jgi:DNA-binding response OmpR family regulator
MNSKKRIAIIEDDQDIVELIKYNLEKIALEVIEAYDGEEGLNLVKTKLPDLIILDLMLPKIDGYEVLRILKKEDILSNIPVVILSAKVFPAAIIKGFKMGVVDYIPKPFSIGELIGKIEELLDTGFTIAHK